MVAKAKAGENRKGRRGKKQKIIVKIVAWSEIKLTRKWNVNKKTETEM